MAHHGIVLAVALLLPHRSHHHQNGFASISENASGFPGYNSHLPLECAPMAKVLRDAGWSTFWIGKCHTTPIDEFTMGASKKNWPLGQGYDRFYGFMGGETNNWFPDLIEDNHFVDQPYGPQDGYHLSKDLTDKAVSFIRDAKQSEPDKPWYMWFNPGANHAPHHAPKEYIDKYKGKFDDGYEAYRTWVLPRMIAKGILPKGTDLTPLNPMPEGRFTETDAVRPWDSLSADEKKLFCRMAEVYAGFSEYTDMRVGRIIEYLEESGQLDNTLIFYCADNGASGEGSPNGSVNENKFFNGYPDEIKENWRCSTNLAARTPTGIIQRAGRSPSPLLSGCSSAIPSTVGVAIHLSSRGQRRSRHAVKFAINTITSPISFQLSSIAVV
jgi:arylsulfatase A-like enzyme